MKSIYELTEKQWMSSPSNNWLRLHGFAMIRTNRKNGKKKKRTKSELKQMDLLPFK